MFFSPFSIAITSLGEERASLGAFRTFVRFALDNVWFCLFPLPLGVWEGLRFVIVALPGLFSSFLLYICVYHLTDEPVLDANKYRYTNFAVKAFSTNSQIWQANIRRKYVSIHCLDEFLCHKRIIFYLCFNLVSCITRLFSVSNKVSVRDEATDILWQILILCSCYINERLSVPSTGLKIKRN